MNKITKDSLKENKKDEKIVGQNANNASASNKLGVFEEDDYFEEFDDEEWGDTNTKDDIDFKQWQEDWEDEDINDQFDKVLRKEMDMFKKRNITK
jgi:26 proteasome complex subunit DSS1